MAGYSKNVISKIVVDNAVNAVNATNATNATNAITASYALNFKPGGPNTSIQFNRNGVVSGSNVFTFNSASNSMTLTGSMVTTGSNLLIGTTTLTGSLNITGSTTQVGNNTLLGNTLLSGSITISGSQGPGSPTASVQIYGDIRQSGYHRFDPVNTNIDTTTSASYIYVSGSTNDLYFSQNSKGYANTTRLRWLEGNLYTGLLNGGIITATLGTNTYQVGSGSGIIVNLNAAYNDNPYPTIQYLNWGDLSANIAPISASFDQQFVAVSSSGGTAVIKAQGIPYTDGDYNAFIPIGIVIHQNHSTINAVQTFPGVAYGWKQRSFDFIKAFGPLKISGYTLAQSGSSTRGLVLSGGTAFVDGRNYIVDPNNPSYIVEASGIVTSKIYRYYQSGSNYATNWGYDTNGGVGYTNIDPTQYSNAGTLTALTNNNKWSIQRVYYFPNSATKAFYIYYGNAQYDTKADAIAALTTEIFNEAPNTAANAIFVGYMILQKIADFTSAGTYEFREAGLFRTSGAGGGGAGGGGTTTLAGLTDVSITSPTYGDLLMYDTTVWNNTKTLSGSYILSGSLRVNNGGSITGSLFGTASWAQSSSQALTASYIVTAQTASYVLQAVSSSFATTASYITGSIYTSTNPALSASYALTASYAANAGATFPYNGTAIITGSLITSGSAARFINDVNITGSLIITGSAVSNVIGGAASGSSLSFQSTTGNQSALAKNDCFVFKAGNNGALELLRIGNGPTGNTDELGMHVRGNTSTTNYLLRATAAVSYLNSSTDTRLLVAGNNAILCSATTVTLSKSTIASAGVTGSFSGSFTGSISLPARSAFRVFGASVTGIPATTTLSGSATTVDYNQGSNYNNTTGVFTAPAAGLYSVFLNMRTNSGATQQAIVYKNSTTSSLMWEATGSFSGHFGVSGILSLAANDTLRTIVTVGTVQFDANDSWGVAYIG